MSAHSGSSIALWSANGLFEDALGAAFVERRPAAVFALEGEHPIHAAVEAFVAALRIVGGDFSQRQQQYGGVVDVGIPLVVELKTQPLGSTGGVLDRPIAAKADFAFDQPFAATLHGGMIFRHADSRMATATMAVSQTGENRVRCERWSPFRARVS